MLDTDAWADPFDIPLQKTYPDKPGLALARARANVARLKEAAAKPRPCKTGDQLIDALALIAHEVDKCRLHAWEYLAELRADACEPDCPRHGVGADIMLPSKLHELATLARHRRRALRDGGAAELEYHMRMHRSMRARWKYDSYQELAEFHNSCLWIEPGEAAYEIGCIWEALALYRSDIWRHIADMHERRAHSLGPDPDSVADLRHCRLRIAELNRELQVAVAASRAEAKTGGSQRGSSGDRMGDCKPLTAPGA